MDEGVAKVLSNWTPVSAGLGGMAAMLLGLLFVSVSLQLNCLCDVTALVFGHPLTLVHLSLAALISEVPSTVLGALLLARCGHVPNLARAAPQTALP